MTPEPRRKICLFAREDLCNPARFSGMPLAVRAGLQTWADVIDAFPLRMPLEYALAPWAFLRRKQGRAFLLAKAMSVSKQRARYARRLERRTEFDVWAMPMLDYGAFFETDRPIATFHDAPFTQLMELYFPTMTASQKRQAWAIDRDAAQRVDLQVYASEWAARHAIDVLGARPEQVRVIPYGANIEPVPKAELDQQIAARLDGPPRLLFVGREWGRKGGPRVLQAFDLLKPEFPDLELHLVGKIPEASYPPGVHAHGYLRMGEPSERALRDDLYRTARLLVVPSRAEGLGIVFCEAAAMAMPAVSSAVGGIPTVIDDGVTGQLVSPEGDADELAAAIRPLLLSADRYTSMARAAHHRAVTKLNWQRYADDLREGIEALAAPLLPADAPTGQLTQAASA